MKQNILHLSLVIIPFISLPAKAQTKECIPLVKVNKGPFSDIKYDYSKGSALSVLYKIFPGIGEMAGHHYLLVSKNMGPYLIEKLMRQYDSNTQIRQFIRNLLEDLIQNPYWTKTKAQLILQSFEYAASDVSFLRTAEGNRILHLMIKTILSGTESSQRYLLLRLDAINERDLKHNDFGDLF